uniref:hypothetical protein n=1 Tax=Gormaniella terricola TaxID=2904618 RepID=UPI0021CCB3A6|nr:hypothetical protein ODF01_mgp12 [Gormaniella terricola]UWV18316.1 hypothetical protein [Gormaniella terricola]
MWKELGKGGGDCLIKSATSKATRNIVQIVPIVFIECALRGSSFFYYIIECNRVTFFYLDFKNRGPSCTIPSRWNKSKDKCILSNGGVLSCLDNVIKTLRRRCFIARL